jgi:sphingolipid delta-4 desaturase
MKAAAKLDFTHVETPDLHVERRKSLMRTYSKELRAIMGNNPGTMLWILAVVGAQFAMAYALRHQAWYVILGVAYVFGAFLNHALYVFVHDSAHNLVFKSSNANRAAGMICDFALVVPGAMAFRKYHLLHHNKMGQYDFDADLSPEWEAKAVGNSSFRKLIWMLLLGISEGSRPMRFKAPPFWDRWIFANLVVQLAVAATAFYFLGLAGIVYLFASTVFGLGLHPLGARWIAEHFLSDSKQETYSYYGPMNPIMFNVGFHMEHHDLMTVAWSRLPEITKIAPEYYRDLETVKSYPGLLFKFITDPKMSLYSRILRKSESRTVALAPMTTREEGATYVPNPASA